MIDVNPKGEVWIFAEQEQGKLSDVPLELLSKGRELANKLSVPLAAVLGGQNVFSLAQRLVAHGADKVYVVEHAKLAHYQTAPYNKMLCELIEQYKPQIVLFGATPIGRD